MNVKTILIFTLVLLFGTTVFGRSRGYYSQANAGSNHGGNNRHGGGSNHHKGGNTNHAANNKHHNNNGRGHHNYVANNQKDGRNNGRGNQNYVGNNQYNNYYIQNNYIYVQDDEL